MPRLGALGRWRTAVQRPRRAGAPRPADARLAGVAPRALPALHLCGVSVQAPAGRGVVPVARPAALPVDDAGRHAGVALVFPPAYPPRPPGLRGALIAGCRARADRKQPPARQDGERDDARGRAHRARGPAEPGYNCTHFTRPEHIARVGRPGTRVPILPGTEHAPRARGPAVRTFQWLILSTTCPPRAGAGRVQLDTFAITPCCRAGLSRRRVCAPRGARDAGARAPRSWRPGRTASRGCSSAGWGRGAGSP